MPPETQTTPTKIEWNKVTWYSKLGAIILFIGVVPALCFYIGVQYGQVATSVIYNQPLVNADIKSAPVDTYTSRDGITGWETYVSPTAPGGFTFQYPSNWKLDDAFTDTKNYLLLVSSNDNLNKNLQSSVRILERVDYSCNKFAKPGTIDGKKALIGDWSNGNLSGFPTTKEICLLDYNDEGLTFLMSAYSLDAQKTEDGILSTFHIEQPNPSAEADTTTSQ